jgi:putative DNA primase/helicase
MTERLIEAGMSLVPPGDLTRDMALLTTGGDIRPNALNLVCAGREDAATCSTAMAVPAVVAADEAALPGVAASLRNQFPKAKFIVCGSLTDSGKAAAEAAAKACQGEIAMPDFGVQPSYPRTPAETSFADLGKALGASAVRTSIEAAEPVEIYREKAERSENDALVEKIDDRVLALAAFNATAYERCRAQEAKALGIRVSYLDRRVEEERRKAAAAAAATPKQPEPLAWPYDVDGDELLGELTEAIAQHVRASPEQALAITLWVLACHGFGVWDIYPILAVTSPAWRAGKTTLMELLERLVPQPFLTSSISRAVLYHVANQDQPTLLLDEADTMPLNRNDLRGILNTGHSRGGARTHRVTPTKGGGSRVTNFNLWYPKAVALIGQLPHTLSDRSIKIEMTRKSAGDAVKRPGPALTELCRRAARWAADNGKALKRQMPHLQGLNDRAMNNWTPAFAVAERCGGDWLQKAQAAALAIEPDSEMQYSLDWISMPDELRLLADISQYSIALIRMKSFPPNS